MAALVDGMYQVCYGGLCFGLDLRRGRIDHVAPAAKWAIGADGAWFRDWVRRRGGTMTLVETREGLEARVDAALRRVAPDRYP